MSASNTSHDAFDFAEFTLDVDRGVLLQDGAEIKLRPKSYRLLRFLVERPGRLVSKHEILDKIWGETVVTDDAITQCLIDIRRAIGDSTQTMVRTVPRRGYIFDIPVTPSVTTFASEPLQSGNSTRNTLLIGIIAVACLSLGFWVFGNRQEPLPAVAKSASLESPSIAVLPFLDLSPRQDLGYFADGIAEEILNNLAQEPNLRVIARTSSFSFKSQDADIAMIQERLNVTHVLEGSVRESEGTVRITAQLIEAATSEHIWSDTYDRQLGDIFAIQEDISRQVLGRLASSLTSSTLRFSETDPEVYRLYLQALHVIDRTPRSETKEAHEMLQQALQLDSEFAPAWREYARVLWRRIGDGPNIEADIARTFEALQKANALDPYDAATLAYIGWHHADFDNDIGLGARLFEQALSIDPANENVVRTATIFAMSFGKPEQAIDLAEFGVARNPLCMPCHVQLARAYLFAKQLDAAEAIVRKMHTLFGVDQGTLGLVFLLDGRPDSALIEFERAESDYVRVVGSAMALHDLGRFEESEAAIAELKQALDGHPYWPLAQVYAWIGDEDAAFKEIERAANEQQLRVDGRIVRWNSILIAREAHNPFLQSLHNDPRWPVFVQKYGVSDSKAVAAAFDFSLPQQQLR